MAPDPRDLLNHPHAQRLQSRARLALARRPRAYHRAHQAWAVGRYLLRVPHDPDFRAFARFSEREGLFLDVGANIGQSAMSFRLFNRRAPILSLEPNPLLAGDLRLVRRLLRGFDFRTCAAAEQTGRLTLRVPVYHGLPLTGEASVDAAAPGDRLYWTEQQEVADADAVETLTFDVDAYRLDELGLAPAFVKVDVEGFELSVLRGLTGTLAAHRPILLVERSGASEVEELLAPLGYRPFAYLERDDRLEPLAGRQTTNVFYLTAKDEAAAIGAVPREP